MTTEGVTMLSDDERAVYAGIADILIPDAEDMPSASQAGVHTRWVDEALRYRPDLQERFRTALSVAAGHEPAEAVELLNSDHIPAFEALGTLTAGAYFLNPDVRQRLGYPGQTPTLARPDTELYENLLMNVMQRGQVYRDAPEQSTQPDSGSRA